MEHKMGLVRKLELGRTMEEVGRRSYRTRNRSWNLHPFHSCLHGILRSWAGQGESSLEGLVGCSLEGLVGSSLEELVGSSLGVQEESSLLEQVESS